MSLAVSLAVLFLGPLNSQLILVTLRGIPSQIHSALGITMGTKMVTKKFKNQNRAQPMTRCSMHPRGPGFFFFLKEDASFFFSVLGKSGFVSVFFSILCFGWLFVFMTHFSFGLICKVLVKVQK
jgi:hypothetical protein